MTRYIYHRIFGYVLTLVIHSWNLLYMGHSMKRYAEDPEIVVFKGMQIRYFTIWNVGVQMIYAVLGLTCDILTLKNINNKKYRLPKHLRGAREALFSSVLWPGTLLTVIFFWTFYSIDRRLIFPHFIDKVLTSTSNHVLHTFIGPVAFWELIFRPREVPRSHKKFLYHLIFHFLLYTAMISYTFSEKGTWIYPIFDIVYSRSSFFVPIVFIALFIKLVFNYYLQWPITSLLHGRTKVE